MSISLTIQSTDIVTQANGVPCRIWEATDANGRKCLFFVAQIAVDPQSAKDFETVLSEIPAPSEFRSVMDVLAPEIMTALTAFQPLTDVVSRLVDACEETFHDPLEMNPEWVQLWKDAHAALTAAGIPISAEMDSEPLTEESHFD